MRLLKIANPERKWYEIILWWEIRRLPYNIIMYFVGYLSFYIGFVTLPLLYLAIGLLLNVIYTFGWIVELSFINRLNSVDKKLNYPKYTFTSYLILSALLVLGIACLRYLP